MAKLDLDKHGLSYIKGREISSLSNSDIEKIIDAFVCEDIAPTVSWLPFNKKIVQFLLSRSYCRRCGQCCLPNPVNPEHPGPFVYDSEFEVIAKHMNCTLEQLERKTTKYKNSSGEEEKYLSLPCMFNKKGKCTIYNIRPFVCSIHPITDSEIRDGIICICINVRCEYGRDLYKFAVKNSRMITHAPVYVSSY